MLFEYADYINCFFYSAGAAYGWNSVRLIYLSKGLSGYDHNTQALYFAWGVWNVYMYSHLTFWFTMVADIIGTLASVVYFTLAVVYRRRNQRDNKKWI